MRTIAIDCGASFIKAALFDKDVMLRKIEVSAPKVKEYGKKNKQITELVSLVKQIVEELAAGENEVALGISNEMHGFLLAYEDGEPFTDYISWQREYGDIPIEGLSSRNALIKEVGEGIIANTGMPLRAGLPSCNLMYLRRAKKLDEAKGTLLFYTLGDYILRMLANSNTAIHPTNAAATGLYDLHGYWSGELVTTVGGGYSVRLPCLWTGKETISKVGGTIMHIFPAIGDQQAALLGAGLTEEQALSFNMGTGAQVSVVTEKLQKPGPFQIRPYFAGKYLKTIPHIPSGRALNVYVRFLYDVLDRFGIKYQPEDVWDVLLKTEREGEQSKMTCDLSFFENAVTSSVKGAILDIGEYDLTLANLMYAVFEKMAADFTTLADEIADPSMVRAIIFSGGVARRIESLRTRILTHYDANTSVTVAKDETLTGVRDYISHMGML